jgi:hypothetical protein
MNLRVLYCPRCDPWGETELYKYVLLGAAGPGTHTKGNRLLVHCYSLELPTVVRLVCLCEHMLEVHRVYRK